MEKQSRGPVVKGNQRELSTRLMSASPTEDLGHDRKYWTTRIRDELNATITPISHVAAATGITTENLRHIKAGTTKCAHPETIRRLREFLFKNDPTAAGRSSHGPEETILAAQRVPKQFEQHSTPAAVLFADMVGSTAYKYGRTPIEGVKKCYEHNALAQATIEDPRFHGVVVKFIGDGLMACFVGDGAAQRALEAGLSFISRLVEHNSRMPETEWARRIDTKIGIHFGDVWMLRPANSYVADPMGQTVDFAARLQDVAPPMHIALTEETLARITLDTIQPTPLSSGPHEYALRGIPGLQEIRTLTIRACEKAQRPVPPGTPPPVSKNMRSLLQAAADAWKAGDRNHAIQTYRGAHATDPRNFEARYRLAEIYVLYRAGEFPSDEDRYREAIDLLSTAKADRPHAVSLWTLVSYVQFALFLLRKGAQDPDAAKRLEAAIRDADHARAIAESHLDEHGVALAKIYLAVYCGAWIHAGYPDTGQSQTGQRFLKEAETTLKAEEKGLDGWLQSTFLMARAMMMINTHHPRRDEIGQVLGNAIAACPHNRLAVTLLKDLEG